MHTSFGAFLALSCMYSSTLVDKRNTLLWFTPFIVIVASLFAHFVARLRVLIDRVEEERRDMV